MRLEGENYVAFLHSAFVSHAVWNHQWNEFSWLSAQSPVNPPRTSDARFRLQSWLHASRKELCNGELILRCMQVSLLQLVAGSSNQASLHSNSECSCLFKRELTCTSIGGPGSESLVKGICMEQQQKLQLGEALGESGQQNLSLGRNHKVVGRSVLSCVELLNFIHKPNSEEVVYLNPMSFCAFFGVAEKGKLSP